MVPLMFSLDAFRKHLTDSVKRDLCDMNKNAIVIREDM